MKKDIPLILEKLRSMHGKPRCELVFTNALELTVATVLSAQCTDERVNKVTKDLFRKYRRWQDYIDVPQDELEGDIRPTGFFRNKAKTIKSVAQEVLGRFHGQVPDDIELFATVKGIGRKSANLIVGIAYGKPAVIVDTHVIRVSDRMGLTKNTDPVKIEIDLKKIVDSSVWTDFTMLITLHGRYTCKAKKPECPRCLLQEQCDYFLGGK
jgi:endonuclease-3